MTVYGGSGLAGQERAHDRLLGMLRSALGPEAEAFLVDDRVIELMLNADGRLWIDRLGEGRSDTGTTLTAAAAERIIRLVASSVGTECHSGRPLLSAELPGTGHRFQGVLPPVVTQPVFSIRKRARLVWSLEDYVAQGILTPRQRAVLVEAVHEKANLVIAGGTGTGKTTLANALLAEIARTGDRIVVLEDTQELQCLAADSVCLRACEGVSTMAELLRATLRLRPDRIVVGEVRGPEALTLLKAWNTGHPGGIATVHANSVPGALTRLEQLVQEAAVTISQTLIAEAVNFVVHIVRHGQARRVEAIARVEGVAAGRYVLREVTAHDSPERRSS